MFLQVSSALTLLRILSGAFAQDGTNASYAGLPPSHTKVLILGGGMAGTIAARTLHAQGIDDFIIVDAQTELGGRMKHVPFGVPGRQLVVEIGANWVQGTQEGNGLANPIWELALKHNLSTADTDFFGSISALSLFLHCWYSRSSQLPMTMKGSTIIRTSSTLPSTPLTKQPLLQARIICFDTVLFYNPGTGERLRENLVDMDLRSAYKYMGRSPHTPQEDVCDYYQIDFVGLTVHDEDDS